MNKFFYWLLLFFCAIYGILAQQSSPTTPEVPATSEITQGVSVTFNGITTSKENGPTRNTEAVTTGIPYTGPTPTPGGGNEKTTPESEGNPTTHRSRENPTTQGGGVGPTGGPTTPPQTHFVANLKFNCSTTNCTFEFNIPAALMHHADPGLLKQAIDQLAAQITNVSQQLTTAEGLEKKYDSDTKNWTNTINDTIIQLENDDLNGILESIQQNVTNINCNTAAYLQAFQCFLNNTLPSANCGSLVQEANCGEGPPPPVVTTAPPFVTTTLEENPTTPENTGSNGPQSTGTTKTRATGPQYTGITEARTTGQPYTGITETPAIVSKYTGATETPENLSTNSLASNTDEARSTKEQEKFTTEKQLSTASA